MYSDDLTFVMKFDNLTIPGRFDICGKIQQENSFLDYQKKRRRNQLRRKKMEIEMVRNRTMKQRFKKNRRTTNNTPPHEQKLSN